MSRDVLLLVYPIIQKTHKLVQLNYAEAADFSGGRFGLFRIPLCLLIPYFGVLGVALQKLRMSAVSNDAAILYHNDPVGELAQTNALGNDNRRLSLGQINKFHAPQTRQTALS